jgi:hypothetical protein
MLLRIRVKGNRQPNLLQVVGTRNSASRFSGLLDCWQQQTNENSNDRNNDKQFNQRKTTWLMK